MSKFKKMPKFKTEAEERAFWEKRDSGDYLDWRHADTVVDRHPFESDPECEP